MTLTAAVDIAQLEAHRSALVGHCYRMLGSIVDAEDAVQDAMVRAWQNLHKFEGRSSLRTWLYRIATNVCLDAIDARSRRARPFEDGPSGTIDDTLDTRPRTHWLEPVPDARALPADANPHELAVLRQSIRLAFVAALQHLPPRQRAALLLTEVLGWSAAEVADCLDSSVASVNSALQRARATLASRDASLAPEPLTDDQAQLLDEFVSAFERYEIDTLVTLLRDDVVLSMPPFTLWLQGIEPVRGWLLGRGIGCRGSKMLPVRASGGLAWGQYRPTDEPGLWKPWALVVVETRDGRVARINSFLDTATLFPLFELPSEIRS